VVLNELYFSAVVSDRLYVCKHAPVGFVKQLEARFKTLELKLVDAFELTNGLLSAWAEEPCCDDSEPNQVREYPIRWRDVCGVYRCEEDL
jgi:hypothetical protein